MHTIAMNLTAPLQLIQALAPGMIARERGHIFNLTSTAARSVFPGTTAYAAAKAGLEQASKVLRYDLAGTGVRMTFIAPGRVETEFYLQSFAGDKEALNEKLYTRERPLHARGCRGDGLGHAEPAAARDAVGNRDHADGPGDRRFRLPAPGEFMSCRAAWRERCRRPATRPAAPPCLQGAAARPR